MSSSLGRAQGGPRAGRAGRGSSRCVDGPQPRMKTHQCMLTSERQAWRGPKGLQK